jgi:TfoX/Sxy family transcriptional regulator of competence genes
MAYDEALAARIREVLAERPDTYERKMFGGIAFMVGGNMCVGVIGDKLMARVGPGGHDEALAQPHASVMDFSGRPMVGYVYVDPEGVRSDAGLARWVDRALTFVTGLPAK